MEIQEHDKKDDRRTEKTKKYLAVALSELIIEKGYESVTIQEIIDRANIGRSTFYAHYENKEELLLGNINFQKHLVNTPLNDADNFPMGINLYYLFNHTRENIDLMDSMAGT